MSPSGVDFSTVAGLVLHHGLASTCSKKVRIALIEKELPFVSRLLNLQNFEQTDPRYVALNPSGVVPTLVFDGTPIVESNCIIEFLEDQFPQIPLAPASPIARAQMRAFTRFADTYAYDAVYVLTWMRLSAPAAQRLSGSELAEVLARVPTAERRERWAAVAKDGFSPQEIERSVARMNETLRKIDGWLSHGGEWLLPGQYSLADVSLVPFVDRIFNLAPDLVGDEEHFPAVSAWYRRMLGRPAVKRALFFDADPRSKLLPNI